MSNLCVLVQKAPRIIEYSPKSKQEPIGIWKNMTVAQLAAVLKKDLGMFSLSFSQIIIFNILIIKKIPDHVFEVMLYVDNTNNLHDEKSRISDLQVIQDIVKKSGARARIIQPPDLHQHEKQ